MDREHMLEPCVLTGACAEGPVRKLCTNSLGGKEVTKVNKLCVCVGGGGGQGTQVVGGFDGQRARSTGKHCM